MKEKCKLERVVTALKDENIVELFWHRDESAIKVTEEKYGDLCHYVAANFLPLREDREECVNDALLVLWNSIPPERPENFSAYLCAAVRNQASNRSRELKAKKRGGGVRIVGEEFLSLIDDGCDLAADYESRRAGEVINAFLGRLGQSERSIFIMRYWMGESVGQISARTGFSEGKVKMMLKRTRDRLAETLKKEGITV